MRQYSRLKYYVGFCKKKLIFSSLAAAFKLNGRNYPWKLYVPLLYRTLLRR